VAFLDNVTEDIQQGELTVDLALTLAIVGAVIFIGYELYQASQGASNWLCTQFPALCPSTGAGANPNGLSTNALSTSGGLLCTFLGIGCSQSASTDPGNGDTDVTGAVQDATGSGASGGLGFSQGYSD
jgi:hypothetical protein